jgi:hypothetical protein
VSGSRARDLRARLLAARTAGAGWPYRQGEPSRIEPTAYALLALGAAGEIPPPEAVAWLRRVQNADGSFGGPAAADAPWVTGPALLALSTLRRAPAAHARGTRWLLGTRSATPPPAEGIATDTRLIGWPWTEGTFGWVEPTAHALIALRAAGIQDARVSEAIRFLHDRRCEGGGWNYGTVNILGTSVAPFPQTTALAVSALADAAAPRALDRDLDVLAAFLEKPLGPFDLSFTAIALDACGRDCTPALTRLADAVDGGWTGDESVHALALAALAAQLPGGANPFAGEG